MSRSLTRREFLRAGAATAGGVLLASSAAAGSARASRTPVDSDVPAMLIDISRCEGCGNCQRSCIAANDLHPTAAQMGGLNSQNLTFVQEVALPRGDKRHVKRQCMHCLEAACASACPVSALHRSPEGPVAYRAERCLGCRYCMVSCPFGVPAFEWDDGLTPEIRKCMFCLDRQRAGESPACVANCPAGALRLGRRSEMLNVARGRIAARPDLYVDHIYGEQEAGGTAMLYISDVPFDLLGFRSGVTTRAVPEYTWAVMSKLPLVVGGMAAVLTGASVVTRRRSGPPHHDE